MPSKNGNVLTELFKELNPGNKTRYFLEEDQDSGALTVTELASGKRLSARISMSQHQNVIGGSVFQFHPHQASSDIARTVNPLLRGTRHDVEDKNQPGNLLGKTVWDVQSSRQRTGDIIRNAFNMGTNASDTTDMLEQYSGNIWKQLNGKGNTEAFPSVNLSNPLDSRKNVQSVDVSIRNISGGAVMPMERAEALRNLEQNYYYGENRQEQNAPQWRSLREHGMTFDDKGRLTEIGRGFRTNPTGDLEVMVGSKPEKFVKASNPEPGASPATWYSWQGGGKGIAPDLLPMQGQIVTDVNRAKGGIIRSNVLQPTERAGRDYEVRQFLFDNTVLPGAALAYRTSNGPENEAAMIGTQSYERMKIGGLNLLDLAEGRAKLGQTFSKNQFLVAGQNTELGTYTNAEGKTESIRTPDSAQNRYLQSSHISIPYYYDSTTGKGVSAGTEGAVSTEHLVKKIQEQTGMRVIREMDNSETKFNVAYLTSSDSSIKQGAGGVKVSEVFTGQRQDITQNGLTLPVSHATGELKFDTAVTQGWFGSLSYGQMSQFMKDWQGQAKLSADVESRGKLVTAFEKMYSRRAERGQELGVNLQALGKLYERFTNNEWQGSGENLINQMFQDVIRNPELHPSMGNEAAARNRRNLEMYGAGWTPNAEYSYGVVSKSNLEFMLEDARRSWNSMSAEERPQGTLEDYMRSTFQLRDAHSGKVAGDIMAFDKPQTMADSVRSSILDVLSPDKNYELIQKAGKNAFYLNMGVHRRMEYSGSPNANTEFMFGMNAQFPRLSRELRMDLANLPKGTKTQQAEGALLGFAAFQAQSKMSGGEMTAEQMPTQYGTLSPEQLTQLSVAMDRTKDLPISDQLKEFQGIMGNERLLYVPGSKTFIPNASVIGDIRWDKLGVESNKTFFKWRQAMINLIDVNKASNMDMAESAPVAEGHEAVRPLFDEVRSVGTSGGDFSKNFYERAIRLGAGGRYHPMLSLESNEWFMPHLGRMAMAYRAGFRGKQAIQAASDLFSNQFMGVFNRYPQLYQNALVALQNVTREDLMSRIGEQRYDAIANDPRNQTALQTSLAVARTTVGDWDKDPYVMALAGKVVGGRLKPINDPELRAQQLTNESAMRSQQRVFQQEQLQNAYDASVQSFKDLMSGNDPMGKVLSARGWYGAKQVFTAGLNKYMNKTLGMGVGYNTRHAMRPSMAAAGYSDKQIGMVEEMMPSLYQPALDMTFQGQAAAGHPLASLIAKSYFGTSDRDGSYLKLSTNEQYDAKGKMLPSGKMLPGMKEISRTVKLDDLASSDLGGMFEFAQDVAGMKVPTKSGDLELSADQMASMFMFQGDDEHSKLSGMLNNTDRSNWGTTIGSYLRSAFGEAPEGETLAQRGSRIRQGVQKILSTPLMSAIGASATRKEIENFDVTTGEGRSTGGVQALRRLNELLPETARQWTASGVIGNLLRKNSGGVLGAFQVDLLQKAHQFLPAGRMKQYVGGVLDRLQIQPLQETQKQVANILQSQGAQETSPAFQQIVQQAQKSNFSQEVTAQSQHPEYDDIWGQKDEQYWNNQAAGGGSGNRNTGGGSGDNTGGTGGQRPSFFGGSRRSDDLIVRGAAAQIPAWSGHARTLWQETTQWMEGVEKRLGYNAPLNSQERLTMALGYAPEEARDFFGGKQSVIKRLAKVESQRSQAAGVLTDDAKRHRYSPHEVETILGTGVKDVFQSWPLIQQTIGGDIKVSEGMTSDVESFVGQEGFAQFRDRVNDMGFFSGRAITNYSDIRGMKISPKERGIINQAMKYKKALKDSGDYSQFYNSGLSEVADLGERLKAFDADILKEAPGKGGVLGGSQSQHNALRMMYAQQELIEKPSILRNASMTKEGKLAGEAEKLQAVLEKLSPILGEVTDKEKERIKSIITETEKLDENGKVRKNQELEQRTGDIERGMKIKSARDQVSYLRAQVAQGEGGESSISELTKAQKNLSDLTREDQAIRAKRGEERNWFSKVGRNLFGGWGLMYARSIGNLITSGLGYGMDERVSSDMRMAQGMYEAIGDRSMPYNQANVLMNAKIGAGINNDPRLAMQIFGAKNPLLRDAGSAATAGLAGSAYAGFLLQSVGASAATAGVLAPIIGLGATAAWGASQAYASSQDPMGTAYRLSQSTFMGNQINGQPGGVGGYLAGLAKSPFEKAGFGDLAYGTFSLIANKMSKDSRLLDVGLDTAGQFIGGPIGLAVSNLSSKAKTWVSDQLGNVSEEGVQVLEKSESYKRLLDYATKNGSQGLIDASHLFGLTKGEAAYGLREEMRSRYEEYNPEALDATFAFAQKAGVSTTDKRLAGIIYDYQMGGWAAQQAALNAQASGATIAQMYNPNNANSIYAQQLALTDQTKNYTEAQRQMMAGGAQFALSMPGWSVAKGAYMTPGQLEQQFYDFSNLDSLQQSTLSRNARNANAQMEDAAYYGDTEAGKRIYQAMFDTRQEDQWKMNRMMNLDPLMLAALGSKGVNAGPVSLQTLDGRNFDARFLSMTDVGLNGQITGLSWGQTSFNLNSPFGGNISASQMVNNMFGQNWQNNPNFDKNMINAGINGQPLNGAITMPDGTVIDKVGGMMGMQLYYSQRQGQVQLADIARSERSMALNEAYTYRSWGLQDQGRDLANAYQEWQFGFQDRQINQQVANFQENMGLNMRQTYMQRGWQAEDWALNAQTRQMQWGWRVEDYGEESRFLTGRERKKAERQFGRDTIMHNLDEDQADKQQTRQKELWKLEDDRFSVQRKQFMQSIEMQRESLERNRQYYEDRKKLEEQEIKLQREHYKEQTKLQHESARAQAEWVKEQMRLQKTMAQTQLATNLWEASLKTLSDNSLAAKLALLGVADALALIAESGASIGTGSGASTGIGIGGGEVTEEQVTGEVTEEQVNTGTGGGNNMRKSNSSVKSVSLSSIASKNSPVFIPAGTKDSGSSIPNVTIFIGNEQITDFVIHVVDKELG